jgi:hypothetical protein
MTEHPLQRYRLIGISGKIGSGKTSLARDLQSRQPSLEKHSFADKLRDVLCCVSGIAPSETRSAEQKNAVPDHWGKSVGTLLQDIGESMRQGVHADTWVLALFSRWSSDQRWVIDDLRHVNEAEGIRARGGLLIRLNGDPSGERARSTRNLEHPSETALDNYPHFDVIIDTELYVNQWDEMFEEIGRQLNEKLNQEEEEAYRIMISGDY